MAKRSITDGEIALIKTMLDRGMKNCDIQFYFNRPNRTVNSGRITQIRDGSYSNSVEIPAAPEKRLDAFLAANQPSPEIPGITAAVVAEEAGALSELVLRRMFAKGKGGVWYVTGGESDVVECKENFQIRNAARWLKPMAALANNRGGYIFFGIRENDEDNGKSFQVVGMTNDEFTTADPADLTQKVKGLFDPTPRFEITTISFDNEVVGVMHVESHPSRPILATKNDRGINEGDIYFRCPGMSARIKYSDLRSLLDNRDIKTRANILPMIERLLQLGPSRSMILDLEGGEIIDGDRVIQIDESLLERVSFIKEGEFDEKSGKPTLRLVGDVQTVGTTAIVKKGIVTRANMLEAFLDDELEADPIDYVRFAVENSLGEWLPVRRFAEAGGLSKDELVGFVNESSASAARKELYIRKFSSDEAAYVTPTRPAAEMLRRILDGEVVQPANIEEANRLAHAIQGIQRPLSLDPANQRRMLKDCYELAKDQPQLASATRKAIARLDELLFPLSE